MLMGNPNLEEAEEIDEEDADADQAKLANTQVEEDEMDNVEALMAGVAIEEKDKVRLPATTYTYHSA